MMRSKFKAFLGDESGATAIEYGLIAALIALGIVIGAGQLGGSLNKHFNYMASKLNSMPKN